MLLCTKCGAEVGEHNTGYVSFGGGTVICSDCYRLEKYEERHKKELEDQRRCDEENYEKELEFQRWRDEESHEKELENQRILEKLKIKDEYIRQQRQYITAYPEFYTLVRKHKLNFRNLYYDWVLNSPFAPGKDDYNCCLTYEKPIDRLFRFNDDTSFNLMEKEDKHAGSLIEAIEYRFIWLPEYILEKKLLGLLIKWLNLYHQITVALRAIGINRVTAEGIKEFNYRLDSIIKDLKNLIEEFKLHDQQTDIITDEIKGLEKICLFYETQILPASPLKNEIEVIKDQIHKNQDKIDKNKSELSQKWQAWLSGFKLAAFVILCLLLFPKSDKFEIMGFIVCVALIFLAVTLSLIWLIFLSITKASKNKTLNSDILSKKLRISRLSKDILEINNNWVSSANKHD